LVFALPDALCLSDYTLWRLKMAVYFNPAAILGQLSQQNPFYNPFSPYPNVGGGIASTLQQLYALRQLQEQQRLKQEQEQRDYELEKRRVGAYEKMAERPSEIQLRWNLINEARQKYNNIEEWLQADPLGASFALGLDISGGEMDYSPVTQERVRKFFNIPEENWGLMSPAEKKQYFNSYVSAVKSQKTKTTNQYDFIDDALKLYQTEIKNVVNQIKSGDVDIDIEGTDLQEKKKRLMRVQRYLVRLKQKAKQGTLTDEERLKAKSLHYLIFNPDAITNEKLAQIIYPEIGKAKEEALAEFKKEREKKETKALGYITEDKIPPGTPTATNPETGERVAYIKGKWIPIK